MSDSKGTILVVDDELIVRDLIAGFLKKIGYEVVEATNGADAVEIFENLDSPPIVVVTDIVMPEMDGPSLIEKLRQSHPALCVLFVSAYQSKKLDDAELEKPENQFLAKPFSFRSFAQAIGELTKVAKAPD